MDKANRRAAKRAARADETRRKALSPWRILLRVLGIPILVCGLTASIFIRTSDYPPPDALRHLIALTGCDAALAVGVAPAREGQLGYHAKNDPDGDGIACDMPGVGRSLPVPEGVVSNETSGGVRSVVHSDGAPVPNRIGGDARISGAAKFVTP